MDGIAIFGNVTINGVIMGWGAEESTTVGGREVKNWKAKV